jgi:hypothetical protein
MKVVIAVVLLAALLVLGRGAWHVPLVALGNGITAAVTGTP